MECTYLICGISLCARGKKVTFPISFEECFGLGEKALQHFDKDPSQGRTLMMPHFYLLSAQRTPENFALCKNKYPQPTDSLIKIVSHCLDNGIKKFTGLLENSKFLKHQTKKISLQVSHVDYSLSQTKTVKSNTFKLRSRWDLR